jgi:murein DD-endopeptidase MepM/ murein hydrolase activator NlpD
MAGDLIGAVSVMSVISGGPHLHFSVHRPLNGKKSESIPVKFRVSDTEALQLVEKKVYRAWEQR